VDTLKPREGDMSEEAPKPDGEEAKPRPAIPSVPIQANIPAAEVLDRFLVARMALQGADPLAILGQCVRMLEKHGGMDGKTLAKSFNAVMVSWSDQQVAKPRIILKGHRNN